MSFDAFSYNYGFNTQPPEGGWLRLRHPCTSYRDCFNTQPPEGSWTSPIRLILVCTRFNTQPPEGGWQAQRQALDDLAAFQHTAARRRLGAEF